MFEPKNKSPLKGIYSKANELKIIVYNLDDLKFAEDQSMKVNKIVYCIFSLNGVNEIK